MIKLQWLLRNLEQLRDIRRGGDSAVRRFPTDVDIDSRRRLADLGRLAGA